MIKKLQAFLFINQSTRQTIAKNATWLFVGQLGSRLARAAIVIYAARVLGASRWGAFSYAVGIVTFLTIFSDLGINGLLTREGSASPALRQRYFASAIAAKLGLLTVAIGGVLIALPWLSTIPESGRIMPILLAVFVFDTLRDLGAAFSRALERMELEASFQIFTNLAIAIFGFILLTIFPTTTSLAVAYALGSVLGLLGFAYALRAHLVHFFTSIDRRLIKDIFTTAWPFGLFGLMGILMLNTDTVILGWLRTSEEVGYYSAAQKIIQLLYVLPSLVAASVFPTLTRLIKQHDQAGAAALLSRMSRLALGASVPVLLVGVLFAKPIVLILFGAEYSSAIAPFIILMISVLVVFPSSIIGNAVFAYGLQRSFLPAVAISFFGNVILDFALIPSFGMNGAAVATLATQLVTNAFIWHKLRRYERTLS